MRPNFPKSELLFCKSYHAALLGWFSFSFLTPAHESLHSHEQSFHSHQWVVGKQFHDFPPNPLPSGIILHLDYSNCFESQGAFNPGPVEHTSLPHHSDVFLRVMDQQSSRCKSFSYVQETKNSKWIWRRLIPAHRLCDKDPSNLRAVLITIIKGPDICSCLLLYVQTLSCCEPLIGPFGSLHNTFFISFVAIVHFYLLCTKRESKFSWILNKIFLFSTEALTTFTDFFFSVDATA